MEKWKPIKGFNDVYYISSYGRVISRNGGFIALRPNRNGYLRVEVWKKGIKLRMMVHRLVMENFAKNPHKLPIVNHKDGNKTNNRLTNLEWVTQSDNIKHAWRTGLIKRKTHAEIN